MRNEKVYIYKLIDAGTGNVGYIGQTDNALRRLKSHIYSAFHQPWNSPKKAAWIREVVERGAQIDIVILTEVSRSLADDTEEYWIRWYQSRGHALTNDQSKKLYKPKPYHSRKQFQAAMQTSLPGID